MVNVEKIRTSELRYRRLFEAAQDGILILDAETGAITDVNPFLTKMLGFTAPGVKAAVGFLSQTRILMQGLRKRQPGKQRM